MSVAVPCLFEVLLPSSPVRLSPATWRATRPFTGEFGANTLFNPAFANGGAILLRGPETSTSSSANNTTSVSAVVYNCSISKNAASGAGSAIFAESSSILHLSHSVLSYNYGFIAALACQGKVNIASTKFANTSAAVRFH